jgi:hypothetical protein
LDLPVKAALNSVEVLVRAMEWSLQLREQPNQRALSVHKDPRIAAANLLSNIQAHAVLLVRTGALALQENSAPLHYHVVLGSPVALVGVSACQMMSVTAVHVAVLVPRLKHVAHADVQTCKQMVLTAVLVEMIVLVMKFAVVDNALKYLLMRTTVEPVISGAQVPRLQHVA